MGERAFLPVDAQEPREHTNGAKRSWTSTTLLGPASSSLRTVVRPEFIGSRSKYNLCLPAVGGAVRKAPLTATARKTQLFHSNLLQCLGPHTLVHSCEVCAKPYFLNIPIFTPVPLPFPPLWDSTYVLQRLVPVTLYSTWCCMDIQF